MRLLKIRLELTELTHTLWKLFLTDIPFLDLRHDFPEVFDHLSRCCGEYLFCGFSQFFGKRHIAQTFDCLCDILNSWQEHSHHLFTSRQRALHQVMEEEN